MGVINVLPFSVANLIAAGEVVDRPASVIKELLENAIDAGATRITVEIQNGGVTYMRVTDNGCGISAEDLPLTIRRHATSKIKDATDLETIMTLGFRGEALAATASVSHLRIISRPADCPVGTVLETVGGEEYELTETGCPAGTSVIVEDLFANVPARRKFLKKDVTESMAVTVNVTHVALSHPEIAFNLIVDGAPRLETAGDGSLKSTVYAVYGRDFTSRLIEVKGELEGITVTGFIGRSDNVCGSRNRQDFFINNRTVKSKTAMAALEQAFVSYLPPEKFPCCILNIGIHPGLVDVNVHPAKLEVHFSNEKVVFEAIYYAVKQALEDDKSRPDVKVNVNQGSFGRMTADEWRRTGAQAFAPIPERGDSVKARQIAMNTPTGNTTSSAPAQDRPSITPAVPGTVRPTPQAPQSYADASLPSSSSVPLPHVPSAADNGCKQTEQTSQTAQTAPAPAAPTARIVCDVPYEGVNPAVPTVSQKPTPDSDAAIRMPAPSQPAAEEEKELLPWRIVGWVFNSYIIVERGSEMLLIDQHAAHERILFEMLKERLHATAPSSQMLMLPIETPADDAEIQALTEYRDELEKIGFEMDAGRHVLYVTAIPCGIEAAAVPAMLQAMAAQITDGTGHPELTRDILFEKALYQASCKAAIKAGREYVAGHLEWVVGKLMELPDITFCPHGRPVAMTLSKKELDKQFERT